MLLRRKKWNRHNYGRIKISYVREKGDWQQHAVYRPADGVQCQRGISHSCHCNVSSLLDTTSETLAYHPPY